MTGLWRDCPVAIVGIGCRFPGAVVDTESFWQLLVEGRSGIREVPPDRWNLDRYYHPDPAASGTMITKWGGFVDNLDKFDARFWRISPREAMRMDPQQRWLLEVAWEAIEDAGVGPECLRGRNIGVFVGIAGNDYGGLQLPNPKGVDAYTNSGSTLSIASNRISYVFDFKGPSVSVDTACSSSAVAVWMACQNIALGTCRGPGGAPTP
jgi:acyl transferase domain-containing protein